MEAGPGDGSEAIERARYAVARGRTVAAKARTALKRIEKSVALCVRETGRRRAELEQRLFRAEMAAPSWRDTRRAVGPPSQ